MSKMSKQQKKKMRAVLRQRDGDNCVYCGVYLHDPDDDSAYNILFGFRVLKEGIELAQLDHKIPGGVNHSINLVLACSFCNNNKRTKTYDEYMREIGK